MVRRLNVIIVLIVGVLLFPAVAGAIGWSLAQPI